MHVLLISYSLIKKFPYTKRYANTVKTLDNLEYMNLWSNECNYCTCI